MILKLHSHYATWWYQWCRIYDKMASRCTSLGIAFNSLCCCILVGMYFQFNYPDTPEMWHLYSGLVFLGLVIAGCAVALAHHRGPTSWLKSKPKKRHLTKFER